MVAPQPFVMVNVTVPSLTMLLSGPPEGLLTWALRLSVCVAGL